MPFGFATWKTWAWWLKLSSALLFIYSGHCSACSHGKDQVFCCSLSTELQSLLQLLIIKSHLPRKTFLSHKVGEGGTLASSTLCPAGRQLQTLGFSTGFAWQTAMVSDGGHSQPLLANLTIKMRCLLRFTNASFKKVSRQGMFSQEEGLFFPRCYPPDCRTRALHRWHGNHPWHPHVRTPWGSSTSAIHPGHPKSFRDILWPEAMLRAWTSPALHPSVSAPATFPASTTEGGRLTSLAVQINVINFYSLSVSTWRREWILSLLKEVKNVQDRSQGAKSHGSPGCGLAGCIAFSSTLVEHARVNCWGMAPPELKRVQQRLYYMKSSAL